MLKNIAPWLAGLIQNDILRGAITKKKRENLGKIPKGGGVEKTDENSQFQFGNSKNLGRGLNFSKMYEFQLLFDSVVCNITFIRNVWNSKMSQFGQRGGVNIFQKCLKFKNVPNWDIVPNFLDFLFWRLP